MTKKNAMKKPTGTIPRSTKKDAHGDKHHHFDDSL
jgi:hypothetical protein